MIVTPCACDDRAPGSVSAQLPPASAARSTITEPARICATASAVISTGARAAGDQRRRDDDVGLGDVPRDELLLAPVRLLVELLGVAARGLGVGAPRSISRKRAPSDSDLLATTGRMSKAETTAPRRRAGRDRLQARDAGAEHQHAGRL